jgi:hypothetical protein
VILDATAGNRHIWGKNKYPEGVVFFDKETNLKIPADVIGTWDKLPFPDNSFDCIIFDPPHVTHFSETSIHLNPKEDGKVWGCWWGGFKGKNHMVREIYKAQREFSRVSSRLCLKWNDNGVGVDPILTLFDRWKLVWLQRYRSNHYQGKSSTFWVKLVRR